MGDAKLISNFGDQRSKIKINLLRSSVVIQTILKDQDQPHDLDIFRSRSVIFYKSVCMHDSILTSCSLPKKILQPVRNLRGSVVRAAATLRNFLLAWVQSPPRCTCNFFLLARVQFPPRVIRVKGDRYCIFALFKDTNNFCKPLGEKSTKKLTQKVTFTYFKNYSGFIMEPIDNQRHLCPLGNGRKCLSKCLICNLMKPRRVSYARKKSPLG